MKRINQTNNTPYAIILPNMNTLAFEMTEELTVSAVYRFYASDVDFKVKPAISNLGFKLCIINNYWAKYEGTPSMHE